MEITRLKSRLGGEFEMKDIGVASKILGIEILRNRKKKKLCAISKEIFCKRCCLDLA